ncbi:hypothetical protein CW304_25060 [Bacillus sp. UFRGS-B20]|nr:hypothetical protein CW304_25060 [Bacillus sp. UFRGS-B20]
MSALAARIVRGSLLPARPISALYVRSSIPLTLPCSLRTFRYEKETKASLSYEKLSHRLNSRFRFFFCKNKQENNMKITEYTIY